MDEKRLNPEYEEHNATLYPDEEITMTDDELQDAILEDSGMNRFQKFVAKLDDKQWTLAQRILGALMGIAAGVALFYDGNSEQKGGAFSWSLIIAMIIALILPNIIEKQTLRRIPKLRVAMVIALAIVIVVYFILVGSKTGFTMTA